MKTVAVTQRVTISSHGERRDCLDQAWPRFIAACGLLPINAPNVPDVALALSEAQAVVLTGGNDLVALGGDAPERDATEAALLDFAEARRLPVLGICRGMQLIQHRHAVPLRRVEGHVARSQCIRIDGKPAEVNSFHHFGAVETRDPLQVWAISDDGVIKAVRHASKPITGIMWHPERTVPFSSSDIALFRAIFEVS
jgi:putative glutamine amidotransferase